MQVREAVAKTAVQYAEEVQFRGQGTFQSKAMRDEVVQILLGLGFSVHKSSISAQNLHPEYVTDYVGRLETGFGNSQYMTYWSRLYEVTVS